jgi:hypothetical protein
MKEILVTFAFLLLILIIGCSKNSPNEHDVDVSYIELKTHWVAMTLSETRTIPYTAFDQEGPVTVELDWGTSDTTVAKVTGGVVTPVGAGTALIRSSSRDVISEPCTVFVAENWIVYSSDSGLRVITPENDRDMEIPGTSAASGPILWTSDGIVYNIPGPYGYCYLRFRPFDGDTECALVLDTLLPVNDIQPAPDGGILLSVFPDIYFLSSYNSIPALTTSDVFLHIGNITFEDFGVSPDGNNFTACVRIGSAPRVIIFGVDGTAGDTISTVLANCPRYSPDGNKVAYGYMGRLWISTGGGAPVEVLSEGEEISGLSWAPDGGSLAMCVVNAIGEHELWLGDIATGMTTKLTNAQVSANPYFPQWIE